MKRLSSFLPGLACAAFCVAFCSAHARELSPPKPPPFGQLIQPVLREFCFDCHGDGSKKGEVSLDAPEGKIPRENDPQFWLSLWRALDSQLMPPAEKPQPTAEQRALLKTWIEQAVFHVDPANPDPGHNTLRRLNREEYQNTIVDLLGVDFPAQHRFPADDSGNGFDNNADVLSLSALQTEKYLDAAKKIVSEWAAQGVSRKAFFPVPEPPSADPDEAREWRRKLLEKFALLAFRRPVEKTVLEKIGAVCDRESAWDVGLHTGMALILSSPRFLFRVEPPPSEDAPGPFVDLDEFSLASRLSYFLWNSCPDPALLELASRNALRFSLDEVVKRMIQDVRFRRFIQNFAGQWLQSRDTASVPIAVRVVLGETGKSRTEQLFNSKIRGFLRQETEMLVHYVFSQNTPVEEIITANYTFLNKPLAEFYGINGVTTQDFSRVELPSESGRVGILTHGSVLMVTSNPTRTSPVKRGLFVLENLLGTPTPPPPPNVPPLEEQKARSGSMSMRQLMEAHRQDALCASCHARLDPIGLALEAFNAIGQPRTPSADLPLDTAGKLATGETFASISELAHILGTSRKGDFYRRLSEKMLMYASGRTLEYYDTPTLNTLVQTLWEQNGSSHALLRGIIGSAPFQKQRKQERKVAMDGPRRPPHTSGSSGLSFLP